MENRERKDGEGNRKWEMQKGMMGNRNKMGNGYQGNGNQTNVGIQKKGKIVKMENGKKTQQKIQKSD